MHPRSIGKLCIGVGPEITDIPTRHQSVWGIAWFALCTGDSLVTEAYTRGERVSRTREEQFSLVRTPAAYQRTIHPVLVSLHRKSVVEAPRRATALGRPEPSPVVGRPHSNRIQTGLEPDSNRIQTPLWYTVPWRRQSSPALVAQVPDPYDDIQVPVTNGPDRMAHSRTGSGTAKHCLPVSARAALLPRDCHCLNPRRGSLAIGRSSSFWFGPQQQRFAPSTTLDEETQIRKQVQLPVLPLLQVTAGYLTATGASYRMGGCADSACLRPEHKRVWNPSQSQVEVRARKADDGSDPQRESGKDLQRGIRDRVEEARIMQDTAVLLRVIRLYRASLMDILKPALPSGRFDRVIAFSPGEVASSMEVGHKSTSQDRSLDPYPRSGDRHLCSVGVCSPERELRRPSLASKALRAPAREQRQVT